MYSLYSQASPELFRGKGRLNGKATSSTQLHPYSAGGLHRSGASSKALRASAASIESASSAGPEVAASLEFMKTSITIQDFRKSVDSETEIDQVDLGIQAYDTGLYSLEWPPKQPLTPTTAHRYVECALEVKICFIDGDMNP